MPIITIAWLYVALMIAVGSTSLIGGLLRFLAWGPVPLTIIWYLFGRKPRKPDADAG